MFELIVLGSSVGIVSGFFGIGGGTILVPLLLLLGFGTKEAIGISTVQMVFSSVYGSYLNNKKGTLDISMVLIIGIGGFVGAGFSGLVANVLSENILEIIFLVFAFFALLRLFFQPKVHSKKINSNPIVLFLLGFLLGMLSMTIGVGGSIILVPILVGFWNVKLKDATSAGLFFVVFSSISGMISHTLSGQVDFEKGVIIGFASLLGVYIGVQLKDKVDPVLQKKLLVVFYTMIVTYLIYRIFT